MPTPLCIKQLRSDTTSNNSMAGLAKRHDETALAEKVLFSN